MELDLEQVRRAVAAALQEDIGPGDVTSLSTIPATSISRSEINARQPLIVAGIPFALETFQQVSSDIHCAAPAQDGTSLSAGATLLKIEGPTRAILTAERVALNFLQRLSGIATLTSQYVKAVAGTRARILDTRKTIPGWRNFDKYAVRCGGGQNHRMGLFDMALIKDNHLAALASEQPNPVAAAVARIRQLHPRLKVEVEADTLEQVRHAVAAASDIILLDNMSLDQLREAVRIVSGRALLEASGGVTLQTIQAIAQTGVDLISVGAITHSAPAVDIGLDFCP
ncbi:MAG: carboxylating nicotinate-nucleotide diphosphorylase [Verrucomicrobiota bacterium]|nr:carboxylating nicotinate-nucleotide diphosphorylase [Verrucomicrobiota bacterium]